MHPIIIPPAPAKYRRRIYVAYIKLYFPVVLRPAKVVEMRDKHTKILVVLVPAAGGDPHAKGVILGEKRCLTGIRLDSMQTSPRSPDIP